MRKLENLKPERVFYYFEEISKIPRNSYEEKEISDYLLNFGKEHGLECYRDDVYNVILRKKASTGYENSPKVVLQGHTDMVCEKAEDSTHDFKKDPINLVVDGKYLKADKTTLGADNGIAVAMMLAVAEDDKLEHGPIEFLFTTSEEIDLGGAMALKPGILQGDMLINLDSEEEGILTAGSAGGENIDVILPVKKISSDVNFSYKIKLQGFFGGHSGSEIHKNRKNSNKVLNEILALLNEKADIVVGERPIKDIKHFSPLKKRLQHFGSYVVRVVSNTEIPDAPNGFRAYSREAAMRLNVINEYTYTLETIVQAGRSKMAMISVPINTNTELRSSRLFNSIFRYVKKSIPTKLREFLMYKSLKFFCTIEMILIFIGFLIGLRFIIFYLKRSWRWKYSITYSTSM